MLISSSFPLSKAGIWLKFVIVSDKHVSDQHRHIEPIPVHVRGLAHERLLPTYSVHHGLEITHLKDINEDLPMMTMARGLLHMTSALTLQGELRAHSFQLLLSLQAPPCLSVARLTP